MGHRGRSGAHRTHWSHRAHSWIVAGMAQRDIRVQSPFLNCGTEGDQGYTEPIRLPESIPELWHRGGSGAHRTPEAPRVHSSVVPLRTPTHLLLELVDVSSYLHNIWPNFVFTEYLITADWIQKWLKILPALIINVLIVFSSWGWFFFFFALHAAFK